MKLGRIFGIQLELHFTFLLLVGLYAWVGYETALWAGALSNTIAIVLIFACVILHELGHSLVAMHYGIKINRILLLPIGGMAEFARMPRSPKKELLITLAGPAVNFFIAGGLILFGNTMPENFLDRTPTLSQILPFLLFINLIMGFFNLIPVFPMDGGRIFRSILAFFLPYLKATWIAVQVGKLLAIAGIIGAIFLWHNLLLAILFGFIFMSGDSEYRYVLRQETLRKEWRRSLQLLGKE